MRRLRPKDGATWLALTLSVLAVAVLSVAAAMLWRAQDDQREALRDRYADRTLVAAALLDSLFDVAFNDQAVRAAEELRGERVATAVLDARAREEDARWLAVVDERGRVLGASTEAPRAELQRLASLPVFLGRSLRRGGFGLDDERDGVLQTAVGFTVPAGTRAIVSAAPSDRFAAIVGGTLLPLVRLERGRAFVIDGLGNVIAEAQQGRPRPSDTRGLARALRRERGTLEADDGRRFFAADPLSSSRWRLVATVPERVLYRSVAGASGTLPWIILVVGLLAVLGVGVLLVRLAGATRDLRRSNIELAESNDELARSNADLEQFAYVASHDLSEPLRTVAGFSQLIGQRYRGRLDPDADAYIDHMSGGVDRMQQLIDDLLVYSRAGREPIGDGRVDLARVLSDVLQAVEPMLAERGAEVTSERLPWVRGEAAQLRQVLQNLVVNAIKFTPPGVDPHVHVEAHRDGRAWRVSVRDNGIGVEPEQREAIFKMFGRLHRGRDVPGTGIGLALVRRIVERHGGRVWVDAADPPPGSVFHFTVPDRAGAHRAHEGQEVAA